MASRDDGFVRAILNRFLPRMQHPTMFLLVLALFVIDMVVPDPIPFVDEAMLALLTLLLGSWNRRGGSEPDRDPPDRDPKDVTDRGSDAPPGL